MAELEAEFQRELERNAMAVRLLQQKAEEAKQAKQRADQSQKRMESMQEKYNHMQDKVETTKQTLQDAETTLARQDKIRRRYLPPKFALDSNFRNLSLITTPKKSNRLK